jgi:hypothetical protein
VKGGHKAGGAVARTRLVISPTTLRLALPSISFWISRTLSSVEAAKASMALLQSTGKGARRTELE